MPFSTANIIGVPLTQELGDGSILVTWTSSSASGIVAQVYENRQLVWWGTDRQVTLPPILIRAVFVVGEVGPGEDSTDFSGSLPLLPGTGNRADLQWDGGYFEGKDLDGFRVYGSTAPGGAVDQTIVLNDQPIALPGLFATGYGTSPYGQGGYGSGGQGHYFWRSDPLANGVWTFSVIPYDTAGNEGTAQTIAVTIATIPNPPARNTAGLRMTYTYNSSTHIATLNWLAAP